MKKTRIELKTLKDLLQNEPGLSKGASSALISDFKFAARDWIKVIKQHMKEIRHDDGYHEGSIGWIEVFFNLNKKKMPQRNP